MKARVKDRRTNPVARKFAEPKGFTELHNYAMKINPKNVSSVRRETLVALGVYFETVMISVLAGNKVTLFNGMSIEIRKKIMTRPRVWRNRKFSGNDDGQLFVINPRRVGFEYYFHVEWDVLENNGMKFYVAPKYKRMLWEILTTTDKDYPLYEHPKESLN